MRRALHADVYREIARINTGIKDRICLSYSEHLEKRMTCHRVSTQTRSLANRTAIFTPPFYSRGYLPRELNISLRLPQRVAKYSGKSLNSQ